MYNKFLPQSLKKANVNCTDSVGRPPLIYRLIKINEHEKLCFVKFLLNKEETVLNGTDLYGKLALKYARKNKLYQVVTVISNTKEDIFENVMFGF